MRTTLILNPEIKKQAQIKAMQEGRTLTEVINLLLRDYISGIVYDEKPVKTGMLSERLHTGDYKFEKPITSETIYELLD